MSYNEILDLIGNWFLEYASDNNQRVTIDSDGFAIITGTFDLSQLAESLEVEIS